jgi:UDP-hydrolysing UDP-N-acetyl-D-glucosamine 2-epimerase
MKDIEASPKLELQIIVPENHQEIGNMAIQFINSLIFRTRPIHSIYDAGFFYYDVLGILDKTHPDIVVCLGDRFETVQVALAAIVLNIPTAHVAGGECTLGAFDNELRNAITMMADIHFTSNYDYSMNLCKMGINGLKIFTVGSPGLDWIHRAKLLSKQELQQCVSIDLNLPFIISCFNPVTRELDKTVEHTYNLCRALHETGKQVIIISSNIDPCNDLVRQTVKAYNNEMLYAEKWYCVDNLDHLTYLSLLQYASLVVGNSSSGIIESASFSIPSVSVGSRQDGRIKASNTFSCPCETDAILSAIDRAMEWNATAGKCDNPYGSGGSSRRIVKILEELP